MLPRGRQNDCPVGVVELLVGRNVSDRVLVADVHRDALTNRHDSTGFVGQERFTPRGARDPS